MIYGAFDYYAIRDFDRRVDNQGEAYVWGMGFNAFLSFCRGYCCIRTEKQPWVARYRYLLLPL